MEYLGWVRKEYGVPQMSENGVPHMSEHRVPQMGENGVRVAVGNEIVDRRRVCNPIQSNPSHQLDRLR